MSSVFITGTDTSCGKTYVTRLLIHYFRQKQIHCVGLKPVASGSERQSDGLINEDVETIMQANQSNLIINKWLFEQPVSPHFIASDLGIDIRAKDIASFCCQPEFMSYQLRLIEGAGGLMVPLNESETWIDFVKQTNMPMIVVVGIRLGCINHSLLLNEAALAHQLPVVGWIANVVDGQTERITDNIQAIQSRIEMPLLATVGHNDEMLFTTPDMEKLLINI